MTITVAEAIKQHPLPWRYEVSGGGVVIVLDAAGQSVPLFTVLDFAVGIGNVIKAKGTPA